MTLFVKPFPDSLADAMEIELIDWNISEVVEPTQLSIMSQLVSSGDSIKIWDTKSYDCLYDWSNPSATTGEVKCFNTFVLTILLYRKHLLIQQLEL